MATVDGTREPTTPRGTLARDLGIFQLKLALDGVKGLLLLQLSLVAAALDFAFGPRGRESLFYRVLAASERFDLWLNLYGPAAEADASRDGLFGSGDETADTLLGRLERASRGWTARQGARPQARRAA